MFCLWIYVGLRHIIVERIICNFQKLLQHACNGKLIYETRIIIVDSGGPYAICKEANTLQYCEMAQIEVLTV